MDSRESQACVITIDNSFSPFLPPFHSNNPLHTIERASKSLQGRSNWTGIFFFFPLHFFLHLTKISSAKCRAEHSSWGNCLRLASFCCPVPSAAIVLFGLVNLGERKELLVVECMDARQLCCHAIFPLGYDGAY